MPQAVFHVLVGLISGDVIRDYVFRKKNFPLYLVLAAGIGALLPDADILVFWLFQMFGSADFNLFHRTFSHSLFFAALFLVPALMLYGYKKGIARKILFMLSLGVLTHLLLDALFIGTIMPFYPLSSFEVGLNLFGYVAIPALVEGVDAILLLAWLVYIEWRHRISDFI